MPPPEPRPPRAAAQEQRVGFLASALVAVRTHLHKLDGLWGK